MCVFFCNKVDKKNCKNILCETNILWDQVDNNNVKKGGREGVLVFFFIVFIIIEH